MMQVRLEQRLNTTSGQAQSMSGFPVRVRAGHSLLFSRALWIVVVVA
jgi:hypothetical protein